MLQSLQLKGFMNCINMPIYISYEQNLCCMCKVFFHYQLVCGLFFHNLHSNHFVKTAIATTVTLEWLLSIMNCTDCLSFGNFNINHINVILLVVFFQINLVYLRLFTETCKQTESSYKRLHLHCCKLKTTATQVVKVEE